jgi:hypothetical protein
MSNSEKHVCDFCQKGFVKETTLAVHMCQPKRRALQKNEKRVQLGYQTFIRFYQLNTQAKKPKTYEEFAKSPYYTAFVKFGSFISNVRPLYPEKYIDYIVTSGIKLEQWCREENYEKYANELIRKEGVQTALERSVVTMNEWATDHNSNWQHYFKEVSTNRAVYHIKDGKISPWIILNCKSGKQLISKFNNEQLNIVYNIMAPDHWALRFRRSPADVKFVKEIVLQSGL